jgi:FolB domain-containing protein
MTERVDHIEIHDMRLQCIVGVRPEERDREQAVRVDMRLGLDLAEAGRTSRIGATIDYGEVTRETIALLRFRRYRLIENAAEEVAAMLFGVHPRLRTLELFLAKPGALAGHAQWAAVRLARTREDYPRRFETKSWGEVEVLLETREAGLYLLHIDAGREIPRHHHSIMHELEWLVRGRLVQEGNALAKVDPVTWSHGEAHSYRNPGRARATLFCCDCPPFIPSDEIEIAKSEGAS